MRIVTNAATAALEPDLAQLVSGGRDAVLDCELCVWDDVTPDALLDSDGHSRADAVLLRGALISQHLLSGCDLAGIRIVGVAHTPEDEQNLDRLRLRERVRTPLEMNSIAQALGLIAPSHASPRNTSSIRDAPPRHFSPVGDLIQTESLSVPLLRGDTRHTINGLTVAVWGPLGSSGVSSVTLALAGCAAQAGLSVLVVDAHVYGGAQAGLLNLFDEAPGVAAACRLVARDELSKDELHRVAAVVAHGRCSVSVLTGIPEAERWPELIPESLRAVLSTARESWDITFVDVAFCLEEDEEISSDLFAPRRNGATLACLAEADVVVGVAGCDSLSLSRYILAMPRLREVIGETPVVTVVNRLRTGAAGVAPEASVRETLQRFAGISETVCVPDDTDLLDRALVAGIPATWVTHRGRYISALRTVFERATQLGTAKRESPRIQASA